MTRINKSEVMKLAWRLLKSSQMHGKSDWYAKYNTVHTTIGSALKQAWAVHKADVAKAQALAAAEANRSDEVKAEIAAVEGQIFMMNMIDRWKKDRTHCRRR
jgi:hypothetical protein